MSKNNGVKVVLGILGVATGIFGGIILARRSTKESREEFISKIRDIFGIYNEEFRDKYNKVRDSVENKVLAIKKSGEAIDKEKYVTIIDNVIEEFKNELLITSDNAGKLGAYLKKDWEKFIKTIS